MPQLLGSFGRCHVAQHRMWALFIVIPPPSLDDRSSMCQRMEPVFIQVFVPELAVEALDVRILGWLDPLREKRRKPEIEFPRRSLQVPIAE